MTIHNGAVYDSVYSRVAAYFLSTCAPARDGNTAKAHALITGIYRAIGDNAAGILGWKPQSDTYLTAWEGQKGRESDIKSIRDGIAKTEAVVRGLYEAVAAGDALPDGLLLPDGYPPLKRPLARLLEACGCRIETGERRKITMPDGCAAGLCSVYNISREYSGTDDSGTDSKAFLYFSRCVSENGMDYLPAAFDALLGGNGELPRLCAGLTARGYTRLDCRESGRVSLDFFRQHGGKPEPLKAAWAERTHSGIEVIYDELRLEPCILRMRVPMYKAVLGAADRLPESVRQFLADNTKTCDGCRYCVQTDKSHTRPLAAIGLCEKMKCPLYPGFTFSWRGITPGLVDDLLAALDAINTLSELQ